MEDLFLLIIKESTGTKYNTLRQTAQIAYDKLYRQHGIHRDPSHELRSVCFTALQMALDTRRTKFITMGLNGLHRIIKDERFYIGLEPEDDSVWLPAQLLRATAGILPASTSSVVGSTMSSMSTATGGGGSGVGGCSGSGIGGGGSSEETVVNVLRLFLAMACSPACTLNGRLLIEILSRCGECWELGSRATRAASLAAASQCLRTFCAFLTEEAEEVRRTAPPGGHMMMSQAQAAAVYNEVIPVMQWLCSRLIEPNGNSGGVSSLNGNSNINGIGGGGGGSGATSSPHKRTEANGTLFLTECILTLTSALPRNVHANPHFTSFLWQKFCPTLAAALGSPGRINLDKKFTYKDALHMIENEARGFFTGPGLDGSEARCVYLTAIQLLRIAGAHGTLRPMLEALFHRMLLLPAPPNRTEPLKCVREIFKSPARLVDLTVILYMDKQHTAQGGSDEMALFRLLIDAMEECAYGITIGASIEASLQASVECMVALLHSLQALCTGELTDAIISDQIVNAVNTRHEQLRDADYTGPLTYQSMARLPAPYRDAVAEFRQSTLETSSGSDSECEQHQMSGGGGGSSGGGGIGGTVSAKNSSHRHRHRHSGADGSAHEVTSNGSGDTEGPEEDDIDHGSTTSSDELSRLETRCWPYTALDGPSLLIQHNAARSTDVDNDRQHARDFARALRRDLVPRLLRLRSCIEVDEAIQEFASAVCQQNCSNFSDFDRNLTAINADGIYLAIYSSLLLSLQLARAGYYAQPGARDVPMIPPMSEQQFVTSVQSTGVLVYLSTPWLCELYQSVLGVNVLDSLAREELDGTMGGAAIRCALVDVLCDAGGLAGTQMLSEWQRLQTSAATLSCGHTGYGSNVDDDDDENIRRRREAAKKLARRLLTCCWDSMVVVLSAGLGDHWSNSSSANRLVALSKRTLRVKTKSNKANGEALYAMCLEGLHAAATLSNCLNLQHLAGKILSLLASNVCQTIGPRISASQALSMDVVLSGGLELGSYSADCWLSIFAVCRHVSQLEHELFSLQNGSGSGGGSTLTATSPHGGRRDLETGEKLRGCNDKINLAAIPIDDDETCVDVYSFLQTPLQAPNTNITSILKVYSGTNETVLLSQADTSKVLSALSHQAENLFNDAAERLSLPSLCQFLKHLCRASREQLYKSTMNIRKGGSVGGGAGTTGNNGTGGNSSGTTLSSSTTNSTRLWWPGKVWRKHEPLSLPLSLLLHRVGDVTLRVFRSSRPLLHILKVWAITGPHLMDAACHRERSISKRAIEYIHDIITALLVEQTELPHFHFNEALLKPFENLLSMDTCDADVQDQIVACLYEIVEAHRTEIRSGWRPLFGTLRNARSRMLNMGNIIDIFRVFLDSDNTLVFANAGLDCILCLLSYLEISGGGGPNNNTCGLDDDGGGGGGGSSGVNGGATNNNNNNNINGGQNSGRSSEFLHETLRFLERCAAILAFMYNMPKCPNFHSTYKIKGISYTHIIDANIPNSMENFTYFGNDYLQTKNEQHMISYRSLHIDKDTIVKIDEMDKPSGVLKVWFLLLDGLTNSLIVCPYSHQAPILQTIFKLFKDLAESPGIDFGFYCVNHLLVPMIQDWLRYINKTGAQWPLIEKNFKHCCCMTTDLVVEFIEKSVPEQKAKARYAQIIHPVTTVRIGGSGNTDNGVYSKLRLITAIDHQHQQTINGTKSKSYDSSTSSSASEENCLGGPSQQQQQQQQPSQPPPIMGFGSMNIINESSSASPTKISGSATLALKQLLIVLIECSAQAQETIARVGVSCLKHVILSTGRLFNEAQWMIACSAIHRACTVTIAPLRQLSFAFHEKSNSFYGDCANVKVAARRDSTMEELTRIYALAQQVFLSDNQRDGNNANATIGGNHNLDDRSYSFLLYPLNNGFNSNLDNFVIRIPFKNLIVGLLANQMLLQLVAKLLLSRLKCVPQAVSACIFDQYTSATMTTQQANTPSSSSAVSSSSASTITTTSSIPTTTTTTMTTTNSCDYDLDFRSKEILLRCVKQYLTSALEFDSRPGLKFLMQKVANIEHAANLYKQMTSSWMIYYIALIDSYLSDIVIYNLGPEDLNFILASCSRLNTTTVKKKENFVRYLFGLQDAWNLVCELYLNNSTLHDLENGRLRLTSTDGGSCNISSNNKHRISVPPKSYAKVNVVVNVSSNSGGGGGDNISHNSTNSSDDTNSSSSPSKYVPLNGSVAVNGGDEESIPMATLISEFQPITTSRTRTNPFLETSSRISSSLSSSSSMATTATTTTTTTAAAATSIGTSAQPKTSELVEAAISPEIEQQRAMSILRDSNYKRAALAQLVVASMELLRSLPGEAAENLRLLMTPTIREALRLVLLQGNELKVNQF